MIAIFPGQPSEPARGFLMLRNDFQDRAPGLARLRPEAGLVQRPRLIEKCLALRRDRDRPVEMRQRAEIIGRAGDPRRQQMRGGISGRFVRLVSICARAD